MPRKKVEKRGPVEALGPEGKPGVILATGEWVKAREEWWGTDPWGNVLGKWLYFRASRTSQLHGFYNMVSKKHGKVATGLSDYATALPVYHDVYNAWNAGKVWMSATKKQAADDAGTLNAYWPRFRAKHVVGTMTPRPHSTPGNQIYTYDDLMKPILADMGDLQLTAFTRKLCKDWADARIGATYTRSKKKGAKVFRVGPGTVRGNVKAAKVVFEQALYLELVLMNPWRGVKVVGDARVREYVVTEAQEAQLAAFMTPFYYRWFRVMVGTGMRIAESCRIDPKVDLCFTPGKEWVRCHDRKGKLGKKKTQEVPLVCEDAIEAFKEQLAADGKLWGRSEAAYRKMLARACKAAEIPHISPHTLRHTFCTRYLIGGGAIKTLAGIVNHTTTAMTEKYIHLLDRDLKDLSAGVLLRKKPVGGGKVLEGTFG